MIQRARSLWQEFSPINKIIIIGGVVVVIALLITATNRITSYFKDKAFEHRQAEYQQKLDDKEAESQAAIARAEMFEKIAKDLEAESAIKDAVIAASGKRAEAAKQALETEDKRYQDEIRSVDDDVDFCTRIKRICERAKGLKLYPANKECLCE
jgi:FtsZ-interacting cell division protein ZipA